MPALIKVDEIHIKYMKNIYNWCNILVNGSVFVHLSDQIPTKPFSQATLQLNEAIALIKVKPRYD